MASDEDSSVDPTKSVKSTVMCSVVATSPPILAEVDRLGQVRAGEPDSVETLSGP